MDKHLLDDVALVAAAEASYDRPVTWERGDCRAILGELDGGRHVVAFPGSENLLDWITDIEAVPVLDPALGWCHRGFLADARGIAYQITHDLMGCKVVVTGHSKGGADGLVFAALARLAGLDIEAVVTFGAPCAGFDQLRRHLADIPIRQYRNGHDPVPGLLPAAAGWRHAREPLVAIGTPAPLAVEDHLVAAYRRALGALA